MSDACVYEVLPEIQHLTESGIDSRVLALGLQIAPSRCYLYTEARKYVLYSCNRIMNHCGRTYHTIRSFRPSFSDQKVGYLCKNQGYPASIRTSTRQMETICFLSTVVPKSTAAIGPSSKIRKPCFSRCLSGIKHVHRSWCC